MELARRGPSWRDPILVLGGSLVRTVGLLVQLVVIARVCGADLLGVYSFALALTTPLVLTLGWNLRVMLSVDADHQHAWSAYRRLRSTSLVLGLIVALAICWWWSTAWQHVALIMLVYAVKCIESLSELGYGVLQRVGDARAIATGNALRAVLVTSGLCLPLVLGTTLEVAVAVQAGASLLAYLTVELPRMRGSLTRWAQGSPDSMVLFVAAWPLGIAVGASALGSGMPRLVLTECELIAQAGALLIVINLLSPASLAINAMQQAFGARMADAVRQRDRAHWRQYLRQSILVGYLACAVVGVAAWIGLLLLTPILGWQVEIGLPAFIAVVLAGGIQSHQTLLGTGLDSMRRFASKLMIQVVYLLAVGGLCVALIPRFGLDGACLALLGSAVISLGLTYWSTQRAADELFPQPLPERS